MSRTRRFREGRRRSKFKGTRLLVHHVAALLRQGVTEAELREDYPNLTQEMVGAAPIYAQAHPRRGRPRKPSWRNTKPLSSRLVRRRDACARLASLWCWIRVTLPSVLLPLVLLSLSCFPALTGLKNEAELICKVFSSGFVSLCDFSRAVKGGKSSGFSPCYGASCKRCLCRESSEQRTGVLRHDENEHGTVLVAI